MTYSKNRDDLVRQFIAYANDDGIKIIVHGFAYNDMTPRSITVKKKADYAVKQKWNLRNIVNKPLDELAKSISEYVFRYPKFTCQMDFDDWHKKIGEAFVKSFNKCIKQYHDAEGKRIYKDIGFGKAQKIINMTFKYLFCCPDVSANVDLDKFSFCHMALDKFTYNEGFYKKAVHSFKKYKGVIKSWSNLSFDEYALIQKDIRDYLSSSDNMKYKDPTSNALNAFEAEFYVWDEYHS